MLNVIALAPFFFMAVLADIVPKPPGTACPSGFDSFGLYCVVRDQTPLALPRATEVAPSVLTAPAPIASRAVERRMPPRRVDLVLMVSMGRARSVFGREHPSKRSETASSGRRHRS